jgi:hypothetical protein
MHQFGLRSLGAELIFPEYGRVELTILESETEEQR